MGNPASKPEEPSERNRTTLDSTPTVATPVKYLELDPRSPSCNIARTPIEILNQNVLEGTAATKNRFSKIIDTDPRSPTTEFIRTPIVVESKPNYEIKLRNKNLDNVKKQLEPKRSVINNTKRSESKTDLQINQNDDFNDIELKRSQSATVIQKNVDCKSIPGLLETNLDDILCPYVEEVAPVEVEQQNVLENNVVDKEVETNDNEKENILVPSPQAIQTENNTTFHTPKNKEDKIKIYTHSGDSPMILYESKAEEKLNTPKNDDVVAKIPKELKSPKKLSDLVSPSVEEFNKKLTNLIYEDALQDDLKQIKNKENSRTPLSIRNCNEFPTKSKLRVSDKPTKLQSGSKIPVLREKKLKEKRFSGIQCENTPPKSLDAFVKTKATNWDADNTLII